MTAAENTWCNQRRLRRQQQRLQKLSLESGAKGNNNADSGQGEQGDNSLNTSTKSTDSMCEDQFNTSVNGKDASDSNQDVHIQEDATSTEDSIQGKKRPIEEEDSIVTCNSKRSKLDDNENNKGSEVDSEGVRALQNSDATASLDAAPKKFILKCVMRLKRDKDDQVHMELEWLQGESRELMYQLFTFLKNKLIPTKKKN